MLPKIPRSSEENMSIKNVNVYCRFYNLTQFLHMKIDPWDIAFKTACFQAEEYNLVSWHVSSSFQQA